MSAVAVQQPPLGLLPAFRQKRHAAAPPASITAPATPKQARTPGIITLSKPLATPPRSSTRARKVTPPAARANDVFQPTPKSEPRSGRKSRSRPTSDEDEHETPSKPRGRRPNNAEKSLPTPAASPAVAAAKPRRNPSRARQSPSPTTESDSPAPAPPAIQKPSGRLAKHRRGLTRSTPALCAAATAATSAPVPVPQASSASSQPSGLSRSAPLATPAMSQTIPARMRRTLTGSEPAPATRDATPKDAPPSPSPPRRVREASWKSQGPLTAPLNGGAGFPSRPTHVRSPSEALFNLSLDETDDEPQDMPILFGRSTRGGDKVYAGGKFQNGPDTTTLPAPSFLSGF